MAARGQIAHGEVWDKAMAPAKAGGMACAMEPARAAPMAPAR